MKVLSKDDMLIVLMPFTKSRIDYGLSDILVSKGEPLSPIIISGGDMRGLLKSGTTRRTGVISAGDIMPTALNHLGIETKIQHTARRIYTRPFSENKITHLSSLSAKAIRHDAFMLPVLPASVIFSIVAP